MPLLDTRLADAIKAKRLALLAPSQIVNNAALDADCLAIAQAVIEELTAHALIPAGIAVATAGSPSAQTGATTAPGTIT